MTAVVRDLALVAIALGGLLLLAGTTTYVQETGCRNVDHVDVLEADPGEFATVTDYRNLSEADQRAFNRARTGCHRSGPDAMFVRYRNTTYEVVPVVVDPPPPYGLIVGSLLAGGTLLLAGVAERV
ncbi:hypothetical protein [Haloglomus halophilum]|uniref:hypothetical protein n=1 Tax=Haloglomus halophilum TaxID=2962672 RepID=UPI0020C97B66|nr:hypothetical protein [Haloglomus halophilum]